MDINVLPQLCLHLVKDYFVDVLKQEQRDVRIEYLTKRVKEMNDEIVGWMETKKEILKKKELDLIYDYCYKYEVNWVDNEGAEPSETRLCYYQEPKYVSDKAKSNKKYAENIIKKINTWTEMSRYCKSLKKENQMSREKYMKWYSRFGDYDKYVLKMERKQKEMTALWVLLLKRTYKLYDVYSKLKKRTEVRTPIVLKNKDGTYVKAVLVE